MAQFLQHPTVAGIARQLEQAGGASPLPPIAAQERPTRMPLSFAQQRLWFLHQLESQSAFYHIPMVFRVSGALSIEALQQAVQGLADRHEVLRTSFQLDADGVYQQIHDHLPVTVTLIDVSNEDPQLQ